MVSILEFKQALGDYATKLTDQEIAKLKEVEEQFADIIIEHILHEDFRIQTIRPSNVFVHRYRNFTITDTSIIIRHPLWKILKTQ